MIRAADLHIHSCFSMASSPRMLPEEILKGCRVKGITIIGTGDILHPDWLRMWQETPVSDDLLIIPTTEVEGIGRVHHLIILPDYEAAVELAGVFSPYSKNINKNGRPRVELTGEDILSRVHECGGIGGPAHAFTPYTSMYAAHNSVSSCYGSEKIDLLELGLSADSSYGSQISELTGIPFFSNSDAHSPEPSKLGREFTCLDISTRDTKGVLNAIIQGKVTLNAGFFPEEGKYNRTGCTRCFKQFSLREAQQFNWKCPIDGGRMKKGVRERAEELSSDTQTNRPPYLHIIPLTEIIQRVLKTSSPNTKRCRELYFSCIETLGDEIGILTRIPVEEVRQIHHGLGDAVQAFREGKIILHPGGGGRYGSFELPE